MPQYSPATTISQVGKSPVHGRSALLITLIHLKLQIEDSSRFPSLSVPKLGHEAVIWVNYSDLTATSLGIMVHKGNHPKWP